MALISIIIPCYNVEKELLFRCIHSVLNQDFQDFEIILVDDGSKDELKRNIQEAALLDERIKLLTQSNQGVSAARNLDNDKANSIAKLERIKRHLDLTRIIDNVNLVRLEVLF